MPHFLRYGTHTEKDFFLEESDINAYDAAIINANMLAYTPKAMSAFALRLSKPFFIDPQTHAFQHGFEFIRSKNGGPKQSVKKLADAYGGKIKASVESSSSLNLEEINNVPDQEQLAQNVLDFQKNTIEKVVTSGSEAAYVNFALEDASSGLSKANISPSGVIAPYFFMEDNNELPLNLNTSLIEKTAKLLKKDDPPLIAQLVISRTVLNNKALRDKVISLYSSSAAPMIFIWIDDFDETEVAEPELLNLKEVVQSFSMAGKKVVNLYGGYFSILLTKTENGLAGVCHGMEYGEYRKVVPVGGGLPRAKYYFRPLHKRLSTEDFLRTIQKRSGWMGGSKNSEFSQEVCDCTKCGDLDQFAETQTYEIKTKTGKRRAEASTSAAKAHSLAHYLFNKKKEYEFAKQNTLDILITDLRTAQKKYTYTGQNPSTEHLDRWANVLSG